MCEGRGLGFKVAHRERQHWVSESARGVAIGKGEAERCWSESHSLMELIVAATDLGSCREDFLFWKYLLLPLPPFGSLLTRVCSLPISHSWTHLPHSNPNDYNYAYILYQPNESSTSLLLVSNAQARLISSPLPFPNDPSHSMCPLGIMNRP